MPAFRNLEKRGVPDPCAEPSGPNSRSLRWAGPNPLQVCDSQVKGEGITLDQAHRLIIGKTQGHIQTISRGYNFGLVQHGGHMWIGAGDLVALVEQARLQEGG